MVKLTLHASRRTKQTPAGEIPVDWACVHLASVVTVKSGGTPDRSTPRYWGGSIPWVKTGEIRFNCIRRTSETITEEGLNASSAWIVPSGSLLMAMYGQGKTRGQVAILGIDAAINQACAAIQPNPREVDGAFLFYNLQNRYDEIRNLSNTGNQENLNSQVIRRIPIPLPPLPEQRKIADILSAWDDALEKLDALIAAKERRLRGLTQQLLSGKRRLTNCSGRWSLRPLGELVDPVARPTVKPKAPFLAAGIRSHGKGVFLKPDFDPRAIEMDELFELKPNDLVVNITFAWEGAIAIVPPEADGALVSHRFPTFLVRESQAALAFLRHCIRTKRFVFDCGLASPGGAGRNRVLSKTAFLEIPVFAPFAREQQRIGSILDTCDEELRLLRDQRAAMDLQKRGLMQRLLTGKVRVRP